MGYTEYQCDYCNQYNAVGEEILFNGLVFCCQECLENYQKENK